MADSVEIQFVDESLSMENGISTSTIRSWK